jgi:hypothetical protein
MSRSSTTRFVIVALAGACTLVAQGQTNAFNVSVTISNCSDMTLDLTLFYMTSTCPCPQMAPPQWLRNTNPTPLATIMATKTNLVLPLKWPQSRTIPPNESSTIEIPAGEYLLDAARPPFAPQGQPAMNRRDIISAVRHSKQFNSLNGYLSITNNERWVFSIVFDKKVGQDPYSWEFWKWRLYVPSRPDLQLSISPERRELVRPSPPSLPQRLRPRDSLSLPAPMRSPALRLPPAGTNSRNEQPSEPYHFCIPQKVANETRNSFPVCRLLSA